MKKICFCTTIPITIECFILNYAKYIHEHTDWDISFICSYNKAFEKSLPEYIHYYPVNMKRGISIGGLKAILKMRKIFKREEFDLVQYSTPNAAFYASIAAKSAKIPVRLYCQWGIRYMGFEGIMRFLFKIFEKTVCKNSTFIEAESHNIRNFSINERLYSKNNSCVVWNGSACGVDTQKFNIENKKQWREEIRAKYDINNRETVFAFAGRLTADKGVNELLTAFRMLSSELPNVKLLIMGGIDNRDSIKDELFSFAENSDRVIFTGNVGDIEKYYAASDVFVAPSYREGFGLVVVEAQAMGLPAIVTDVPGQVDAIIPNNTGLLCKVKDPFSLYSAMKTIAEDFEKTEIFSENAKIFAVNNFEQQKLFSYLTKHRNDLIRGI